MLEVRHISKNFGSLTAVSDLNFTVQSGQIMGLIGQNGSGKTTTFRMILGLLVPNAGEVYWKGQPITEKMFDDLGYLPEERGLYLKMTIEEQILYFSELRGKPRKEIRPKIDDWLEKFEVKGKKEDKIETLSKGNQQKVQLITTLIHEPDLIILDEPFSGLDPVNAELLEVGVFEARDRGAAIIFSSHNMNNVADLCDHLLMLKNGRTVLNGGVADIRQSYGRTRLFLESDWSLADLAQLPGVESVKLENNGLQKLILEDPAAGQLIFDQVSQGHYIPTFSQQPPSLEEIFKMKAGTDDE